MSFLHDCESELSLIRNKEEMNQIVREASKTQLKKVEERLTDDMVTVLYTNYKNTFKPEETDQPKVVTAKEVLDFAKKNPAMRTLDINLLVQRFFCEKEGFGDLSKKVRPPKPNPMMTVIKSYNYRTTRHDNSLRRAMERASNGLDRSDPHWVGRAFAQQETDPTQ